MWLPHGEQQRNTRRTKLSYETVAALRQIYARDGVSFAALARKLNVSSSCVEQAVKGETWGA